MIIVTGAAGFIGSNLIAKLNQLGYDNILAVDDLSDGRKFRNLVDLRLVDYLDKDDFLAQISTNRVDHSSAEVIFHQGACSATTEWDGRYMMRVNYDYSKALYHFAQAQHIPFIYASSAATYGLSNAFRENPACEGPLNVYGYSKLLFDQWIRQRLDEAPAQIAGLRYFNVYGPREQHKGSMASVAWHFYHQVSRDGVCRLFEGSEGFGPGEQKRDFITVQDVVNVNIWLWQHPEVRGIFNVGTGAAQTFNDVANAVLRWHSAHGTDGRIQYIPFPDHLKGAYQSFTQADISALRASGYDQAFQTVEEGVHAYLDWIKQNEARFETMT
ncbi:MAG: ADP-glyceromanno-heptose 6-epimerase [Gammaproteobacteria bacterium]